VRGERDECVVRQRGGHQRMTGGVLREVAGDAEPKVGPAR
jgi:hypothetical protein